MNFDNKINGCIKRIKLFYKQAINNQFTDDLDLEIRHYKTLHKQINYEIDTLIRYCNILDSYLNNNMMKNIVIETRDNGDME